MSTRAGNSDVNGWMWLEFEFLRDFTAVRVICKFGDDWIKNEGAVISTTFSTLKVYREKFQHSRASNSKRNSPIWPEFEIVRDFMPVLLTCKLAEDPFKTKGAIMSTTFFSGAQGQVTPKSMDRCGRNSNSSEILWLPWLPASLMTIRSKWGCYCVHKIFSIISLWKNISALKAEIEFVQDFMPVLVICKFEEDPIKTEGAIMSTTFSPL